MSIFYEIYQEFLRTVQEHHTGLPYQNQTLLTTSSVDSQYQIQLKSDQLL